MSVLTEAEPHRIGCSHPRTTRSTRAESDGIQVNIKQIVHYAEDDSRFQGDYYSVTLKDGLGETIATFGDAYHDRGFEKVEGFVLGVEWATRKKVNLTRENVADGEG